MRVTKFGIPLASLALKIKNVGLTGKCMGWRGFFVSECIAYPILNE